MSKKRFAYDYPRPSVTVDIVLVTSQREPHVLLIRRKKAPFAGRWALPGGFVDMDETLEESARRELREETGLTVGNLEQLHTFGNPTRDPRGRVISVAFLGRVSQTQSAHADDDAAAAAWFPLNSLPELAFDHDEILTLARKRISPQRDSKRTRKRS